MRFQQVLIFISTLCTAIMLASCSDSAKINESNIFFKDIYIRVYNAPRGDFRTYALNSDGSSLQLISNLGGIISAPNGNKVLIAAPDGQNSFENIYLVKPDGSSPIELPLANYYPVSLKLSPDGEKILFFTDDELYICNSDGTNITLISSDIEYFNVGPEFSPNGKKMAFIENYPVLLRRLVTANIDGSNKTILREKVRSSGTDIISWSPDGNKIVFSNPDSVYNGDLYSINIDGSNYTMLTHDTFSDFAPKWSPDGTKIAFISGLPNGLFSDIIIINSDGSGYNNISNTPNDFDTGPHWSPDGSKLLYVTFNTLQNDFVRIYDLTSHNTTTISDSANYYAFWNMSK